ncbi:hypothetical protein DFH11DRAFT_1878938 [Phellopilus nigrolimitatus]|nr:hypothetical protein DFH11DRAFT_1878938 [Phellopilus nigrolimitatus]
MYSRCARRVVCRALSKPRYHQLPHRRCLTTEHVPTTTSANSSSADVFPDTANDLDPDEQHPASSNAAPILDFVDSVAPQKTSYSPYVFDELEQSSRRTEAKQAKSLSATHKHTIMVYPQNGARDMPDVLAIVRDIERRFGRVREFKALHDKDSPSNYLRVIFIRFDSSESARRVEELGSRTITVRIQPWNRALLVDGGVGLEDIQRYLREGPMRDDAAIADALTGVEDAMSSAETGAGSLNDAERWNKLVRDDNAGQTSANLDGSSYEEPAASPFDNVADGEEYRVEDAAEKYKPENEIVCNIEFVEKRFTSTTFAPYMKIKTPAERRQRLARAFVAWSGFYTGYDFKDDSVKDELPSPPEGRTEMSDEKRARAIRVAAHSMRHLLLNMRIGLRDAGDMSHGLIRQNGQLTVAEWCRQPEVEAEAWTQADAEAADDSAKKLKLGAKEGTKATADFEVAERAVEKAAPKELTKAEAEMWQKVVRRMAAGAGDAQKPAARKEAPRVSLKKTMTVSEPTLQKQPTSSSSAGANAMASSSPSLASSDSKSAPVPGSAPKATVAEPLATISSAKSSTSTHLDASTSEIINNRARRQARKEEAERRSEQDSFKNKLLGWVRQGRL